MKKILLVTLLSVAGLSFGGKYTDEPDMAPWPPCEGKMITKMWYETSHLGSKTKLYKMKVVRLEDGQIWAMFDGNFVEKYKKGVRMGKECHFWAGWKGKERPATKKGGKR